MTREEAIKILADLTDNIFLHTWEKQNKALHMAIEALDAEQVTGKLKNPCYSLLTDDSAECKEKKSKLEHDREWIIGCIKHDGFIKTDRFDKANRIILDALSAEAEWIPCNERLPSESGYYLVTNINAFEEKEVCVIWFAHKTDYGVSEWRETTDEDTILAWMPLPKPYREDGDDDECPNQKSGCDRTMC